MSKKSDMFSELVSRSITHLVKKELNVSVKEIIEDIEDPDNERDVDKDKLPATATAYLTKNKKYKGHFKKFVKKAKKYKGGLKKYLAESKKK